MEYIYSKDDQLKKQQRSIFSRKYFPKMLYVWVDQCFRHLLFKVEEFGRFSIPYLRRTNENRFSGIVKLVAFSECNDNYGHVRDMYEGKLNQMKNLVIDVMAFFSGQVLLQRPYVSF